MPKTHKNHEGLVGARVGNPVLALPFPDLAPADYYAFRPLKNGIDHGIMKGISKIGGCVP